MVGECRDVETAKMAIQASLTGHVVFSTIHANDAVGVISRLLDMKIDPFLVATALSLPIAQRLVRTICQKCRTTVDGHEMMTILHGEGISEEKLSRLGIKIDPREPCWHGAGCTHCRHTGYSGRRAVFEMFEMTEEIRERVMSPQFAANDLQRMLRDQGTPTMVDNAIQLVEEGQTSYVEVARVLGDGVV
jgi:type IV pilus assembly protein PilB